jgi:CubicO group peptidase (beta-lactamase class C family)
VFRFRRGLFEPETQYRYSRYGWIVVSAAVEAAAAEPFLDFVREQIFQSSQRLPSGTETGYGLGWDLETVTLAGAHARAVGHDGDSLGGMVTSLMTFPERGLVVAVTSNISYAHTPTLALQIAGAFAR